MEYHQKLLMHSNSCTIIQQAKSMQEESFQSHSLNRSTTRRCPGTVLFFIIFIIVIDYISKLSADDFGYKTHKRTSQPKSQRTLQSRASREDKITDQKLNDLALVDYIALLENDKNQAQLQQLSAHQQNAARIGLDINVDSINPT